MGAWPDCHRVAGDQGARECMRAEDANRKARCGNGVVGVRKGARGDKASARGMKAGCGRLKSGKEEGLARVAGGNGKTHHDGRPGGMRTLSSIARVEGRVVEGGGAGIARGAIHGRCRRGGGRRRLRPLRSIGRIGWRGVRVVVELGAVLARRSGRPLGRADLVRSSVVHADEATRADS